MHSKTAAPGGGYWQSLMWWQPNFLGVFFPHEQRGNVGNSAKEETGSAFSLAGNQTHHRCCCWQQTQALMTAAG